MFVMIGGDGAAGNEFGYFTVLESVDPANKLITIGTKTKVMIVSMVLIRMNPLICDTAVLATSAKHPVI